MIRTDKRTGYTYLPVTREHCYNWGGWAVCDHCNQEFFEGYLVFVLNGCLCPSCFHDWIKRAKIYKEDLQYQQEHSQAWYDYHIKHGHIKGGE